MLIADRAFRRLWVGNTAASLATGMLPVLLALAVLDGHAPAAVLGLALASRTVGFLVATPVAGVLADRFPRRTVITAAGVLAALGSVLLSAALERRTGLAVAAAGVLGVGQGAYRPAFQAAVAEVVASDRRQSANAMLTLSGRVVIVLAPGAAALLAVWIGAQVVLAATAGLWLVTAGGALGHRRDLPAAGGDVVAGPVGPREGVLHGFAEGLREARRHRWFVAGLAALSAQLATGYAATAVLLPVITRDRYGGSAVLAAALTAYTLGALSGAVLMIRWRPARAGWVALSGAALYTLVPLCLAVPVPSALLLAAYAIAGFGVELFNVPWFTATQREVAPGLLARVSSIDFLFSYGLAPFGLALLTPAAQAFGNTPVLLACAGICLTAPLLAILTPGTRRFTEPTQPPDDATCPPARPA